VLADTVQRLRHDLMGKRDRDHMKGSVDQGTALVAVVNGGLVRRIFDVRTREICLPRGTKNTSHAPDNNFRGSCGDF
jgi:hypothetical protein